MRVIGKIFKWLLWLIVVAVIGGAVWLWIAPPVLIRVAANYTAKIVCSNVFLAGRDAGQVLAVDVQAPGHPILKLMMLNVDKSGGTVSAGLGIGLVNKVLEPVFEAVYGKVIILGLIVAFLQLRPTGIFPARGRSEE